MKTIVTIQSKGRIRRVELEVYAGNIVEWKGKRRRVKYDARTFTYWFEE